MSIQSFVRRARNRARDLLFVPGTERLWAQRMRGCVTALLYHRIAEPGRSFLDHGAPPTPPEQLRRELRFLARLGARFTTFDDILKHGFPRPHEIVVVVTFDDCTRDNYGNALEIVSDAGAHAVLFQITSLVGATSLLWEHELYWHLEQDGGARLGVAARDSGVSNLSGAGLVETLRESVAPDIIGRVLESARSPLMREEHGALTATLYPGPAQLTHAAAAGHQIGSHGAHHYKRSTIDATSFEAECKQSYETLTALLGHPPAAFSYPFSSVASGDSAIVRRYFRQAMVVAPGGDAHRIRTGTDAYAMPRFTWRGPFPNARRERRWLLEGTA